jgi:HlyD family secretion protein
VLKVANAALRFRPPGEPAATPDRRGGNDGGPAAGAAAGPGGGPGAQFRERLVADLKLDAGQQAQLDPILADLRSKLAAAREQPEEVRGKAMAAARAESRARIEQILNAEQKARYAEIAADLGGGRGAMQGRGRVWRLADGKAVALEVRTGLSDGTATEISGAGVTEGLEVLVGTITSGNSATPAKGAPPRMFF